MSIKSLTKKKKREEKKRHAKGRNELGKPFSEQEKKRGRMGLYLIGLIAIAAASFAFVQFSKLL